MTSKKIFAGNQPLHEQHKQVSGSLKEFDGESMYCIENFDSMPAFFMSIVSNSDLWMYLSSKGSLTAGRQNFNQALFPYYTDDKIHDYAGITGPHTTFRLHAHDKLILWEPFSDLFKGVYKISRNLYKNTAGSKIVFEEINHDLQLQFTYSWMNSEELGWIRKCELCNLSSISIQIDITDGLLNIIPAGITRDTQATMSTLMDAYKIAEWLPGKQMALFRLSSIPIDRAEPNEALKVNAVWSHGLPIQRVLLSANQLPALRAGDELKDEMQIVGEKTALLIHSHINLEKKQGHTWYMIADVNKDHSTLATLHQLIIHEANLPAYIEQKVKQSTQKLHELVALSDGIQHTGDTLSDRRHFANVMFNIMRGGIFHNLYQIDKADFLEHISQCKPSLLSLAKEMLDSLPENPDISILYQKAKLTENPDLIRLTLEYLPLSFSRRHGDPSRPWNAFDIRISSKEGKPSLNYQGNWRDIFQNWETLAFSFPGFLPGMITRFLNASTADGYNPYRLTRQGFDWEVPKPENPWAYIGYWGDHQIIYLLRLLEMHEKFFPGMLAETFAQPCFVYANVPYRIKTYEQILENPKDTIVFDWDAHHSLMENSKRLGADAKLLHLQSGELIRASFTEKLLLSLLTKMSNFVPEAGIWLTTQRPEWNDANNALVGNGASMVCLYQMKRFVDFMLKIYQEMPDSAHQVSTEVFGFFAEIAKILQAGKELLKSGFSDNLRKSLTDQLGKAGCHYRKSVYDGYSGAQQDIEHQQIIDFLKLTDDFLKHSIDANKREDGLYHSYNLIDLSGEGIAIRRLKLMLEGQVAVISSGHLNSKEVLHITESLFKSGLWRPDQQSFMLYPLKQTASFTQINLIPKELIATSPLLQKLLEDKNTLIVEQDVDGNYHFNAEICNERNLREQFEKLQNHYDVAWIKQYAGRVFEIYEAVFHHSAFTGRSGSFFKYEGIGSIYWHMVSKLLLAVGENIHQLSHKEDEQHITQQLIPLYYRIREGIGAHKQPAGYGAFPTDPYSHTPSMRGVQQPGLTGQVKEDVLNRFNELGLDIFNGQICFNPVLLQEADFVPGNNPDFAFTYCGIKISCSKAEKSSIDILYSDKATARILQDKPCIPASISKEIFARKGQITEIRVCLASTPK